MIYLSIGSRDGTSKRVSSELTLTDLGMFERLDYSALVLPVSRVKVVFNAIVGATRQLLRDVSPPITKLLVQVENHLLFFFVDGSLLNEMVQMVMPPKED